MEGMVVFYENYTPIGDILVMATGLVFFALIHASNINNTDNYKTFKIILAFLNIAAAVDVIYHIGMTGVIWPHIILYALRVAYHVSLFVSLYLYVIYICQTLHLGWKESHACKLAANLGLIVIMIYDTLGTLFRFGFVIYPDNSVKAGFPIFPFGYIYFIGILMYLFYKHNNRVYHRILYGIMASIGVSFLVMMMQGIYHQSSYTTATFLFPAFSVLYLIHSNPFDFELGAINARSFDDMIHHNMINKNELFLMSLRMPEFERSGNKYPDGIRDAIRRFSSEYLKGALLFQLNTGHLILVFETRKNPEYEKILENVMDQFYEVHNRFRQDYKIVFSNTYPATDPTLDYLQFIKYVSDRIGINEFKRADESDVTAFKEHQYIVKELSDIQVKMDMDDPRVLVYCQPVLNTSTGKYDTAEALMRLRLDEMGMVFPDRFIPIAENHNYIHTLSLIMLSKVCRDVKAMLDSGYYLQRVSVNISAIDIREPDFCNTVKSIISESGVPFEKIAIEITESQSEKDFILLKERINELRDTGIKFYLDDFGTGYSNFERIIELPFDIVKFDRSLTTASGMDVKSETMVQYLAHLFTDMAYSVLYEGVETSDDEARCMSMCARYLQGYKYSKPIPFEDLRNYFEKRAG